MNEKGEMGTAIVDARELGRWYGQVVGLSDLSVRIGPGITGLLGPNGAGKSTFLQLVVGCLRPNRGELTVLGQRPFASRELYRRLGFAPQQDALYDDLNARDMVAYLLRLAGYAAREARQRSEAALARVGLSDVLTRRVGSYSKGMRQRVKIAQAIAHEPEFVVLDEPLTGLDPVGRREVIDLLRALADEGVSVLASSHVLHEVETLTEEIVLLHRGRLLARGSIADVRGLLSQHPSRVEVVARKARALGRELLGIDGVLVVEVHDEQGGDVPIDGRIRLQAQDRSALLAGLTEIASGGDFGVTRIETADESLEAVFDYLVTE
ncbi:MAG: ABC-2 type transport system ATP-binding protein [Planctomycetota bacterium]|jgi:ABC-2 type transport system ATP-binding protein